MGSTTSPCRASYPGVPQDLSAFHVHYESGGGTLYTPAPQMAVGEGFEPSTRAINPSASLAGRCIQPALLPSHGGQGGIRTHGPLSRHRRFQVYAVMTTSAPVHIIREKLIGENSNLQHMALHAIALSVELPIKL